MDSRGIQLAVDPAAVAVADRWAWWACDGLDGLLLFYFFIRSTSSVKATINHELGFDAVFATTSVNVFRPPL